MRIKCLDEIGNAVYIDPEAAVEIIVEKKIVSFVYPVFNSFTGNLVRRTVKKTKVIKDYLNDAPDKSSKVGFK